ncbi:MAG TPA: hypothetical protein VFK32_00850, partial [Tepidiformaceae bacterium]|nr:hypothetical protein [Tepidiformaceae bacterium]
AEDIADTDHARASGELGDVVPWEALLSRLEDLEDAFELSEAIRTDDASEGVPLAQVRAELGL